MTEINSIKYFVWKYTYFDTFGEIHLFSPIWRPYNWNLINSSHTGTQMYNYYKHKICAIIHVISVICIVTFYEVYNTCHRIFWYHPTDCFKMSNWTIVFILWIHELLFSFFSPLLFNETKIRGKINSWIHKIKTIVQLDINNKTVWAQLYRFCII